MSSAPRGDRVVHQDYIVRQRYSNALPPPHMPPKLLNVPTDGMAYYCSPAFATRLARAEPLNIEADAFLGMPIDLVGMPGIFDGDESSIQAPLIPPPIHPHDRNLLRPLKSLGAPKTEVSGVSFLRRTQYVANDRHVKLDASRNMSGSIIKRAKRVVDHSKDDPTSILRSAIKGFDIANPVEKYIGPDTDSQIRGAAPTSAENDAWKNPKHPTKPNVKPIATYQLLPDLEGLTELGGYGVLKYSGPPSKIKDRPDERLDCALLHGIEPPKTVKDDWELKMKGHKADPDLVPPPGLMPMTYEYFVLADAGEIESFKQACDIHNPNRDDPELFTHSSTQEPPNDVFMFERIRVFESGLTFDQNKYPFAEVALTLRDEDPVSGEKAAAYFYPISAKTQLKARRDKAMQPDGGYAEGHEDEADQFYVKLHDPNEEDEEIMQGVRDSIFGGQAEVAI